MTGTTVIARQVWWNTSTPSFLGPIDWQNPLGSQQCTGGAPTQAIAGGRRGLEEASDDVGTSRYLVDPKYRVLSGDEYDLATIPIEEWLKDISSNDDASSMALARLAAIRMELRESLDEQLGGTWENYLERVEQSAPQRSLFEGARVQRIKALMDARMLEKASTLVNQTLKLNISDELWSYCQGQKIFGSLLAGKGAEAEEMLGAIRNVTDRIDSDQIEELERMAEGFAQGTGLLVSAEAREPGSQTISRELTPTAYALEQNYPNPFNPTTTIRYSIPEQVYVRLEVFSVLGERVAVLVDGVQSAGFKSVEFAVGNYPSGLYIYRLQAGIYSDVKKMILMK
jgi:hypothetical protein